MATVTEGHQPAETKLGGGMAWWVWILAVTFVVYLFSFQTGYSIVNPNVQGDVGLSVGQVATIAAVYTWVFAICQFFGGALLDRLGARKVLPFSIALVVLGIFIFANANSYGMLLLSQVILATGSCTGFVGAGYIGGQWFGMAKFSFMFGLVQVVAALTSAFSVNIILAVLGATDWRSMFNVYGIVGVVLLALGAIYIRNPQPVSHGMDKGVGEFFSSVIKGMAEVAKMGHVWIAAIVGAATFGTLLALGVVWMPKVLMAHGLSAGQAGFGTSMLWLGLAAGSAVTPWWSDKIRNGKIPIIIGNIIQLLALAGIIYMITGPAAGPLIALCFLFGFANAAHMLSFSTAADVVQPYQIGTSAAIVNGIMFIFGGILISRPGMRVGLGLEQGIEPRSMDLVQFASRPLFVALILAVILAFIMKETYPKEQRA